MKYNPNIHHRRSIRLKGYDYTREGTYFITICTRHRESLFGQIVNGTMILNENGTIIEKIWFDLPNHNPNIILNAFIIMPDHVHAIITIPAIGYNMEPDCLGNKDRAGLEPAPRKAILLSEIVRQLKTFSAKEINRQRNTQGVPIWQKNYYEHIIRTKTEFDKITEYIMNNPKNWCSDTEFIKL